MRKARFTVVLSVHLFVVHGAGEVLLQRRRGTPYMDGWWACGAAGHVERGESLLAAAAREAREELGIEIEEDDLEPVATLHRTTASDDPLEERLDVFFAVRRWRGDPHIAEPDKTAELTWWSLTDPPARFVPHEAQALKVLTGDTRARVLTRGFNQRLTLVAAVGANGVIGDGHGMPWHLPADLHHFQRLTTGGVLVMGRRTFDSIGRALPGRRTVVVTRDRAWSSDGVDVAHSVNEALLIAGDGDGAGEIFVVGGGEIYRQFIGIATRLVISEVKQRPVGSVTFPVIDATTWVQQDREAHDGFVITSWVRRPPRISSPT